ncbi:MAG: histidine--tRNA ligase [Alphaproteobacteria bacterium]|nr:histidine--tRNA ligase [Alphaproteobacteria bacterium]
MNLQNPRGTYDALPEMSERLRFIENTAVEVFRRYGYGEIRTPVFEHMDVFARNVGDSTDIVSKEMYVFDDRGGDKMALRPEGTAGVVRAYYSNGLKQNLPLKLCYAGIPVFRYERPQKGRYRQHHQVGIECFGFNGPAADVETIAIGFALLKALGIDDGLYVTVNSLGSKEDRVKYREALVAYFEPHFEKLSADSKERLHKNPLRILDSKSENDRALLGDAPKLEDYLSEESKAHFADVKAGLDALGLPYKFDGTLVRGLDYYTHTVFEIHSDKLGAQSQVISGGRYDGLVEQMGKDSVAGVGFGSGTERLEAIMREMDMKRRPVSFIAMGEGTTVEALRLADKLRAVGLYADVSLDGGSFKSQMKRANKLNACYSVIIGEDEMKSGEYQLKDMDSGEQHSLRPDDLISYLTRAGK